MQPTIEQKIKTLELQRQYLKDFKNGIKHYVEHRVYGTKDWIKTDYPIWNLDLEYRFSDEKVKKEVKLGPEDFQGIRWIKRTEWGENENSLVMVVTGDGIETKNRSIRYEDLAAGHWLYSKDCITWNKCSKIVYV